MKRFWIYFKWLIVSLVLILVITEITLRITSKQRLCRWESMTYQADTLLGHKYIPGWDGIYRNSAYTNRYTINSLGFPGKEFSPSKKTGIYRILVVGTCDETGLFTNGPDSYISLLNKYFDKNKSNVELINLCIDGRDRGIINMNFIENQCANYEPDLILYKKSEFPFRHKHKYRQTYKGVCIYYNAYNENLDMSKSFIDNYQENKPLFTYLYDYSYTVRYMCRFYMNRMKQDNKIIAFMRKYLVNEKLLSVHIGDFIDNWTVNEKGEEVRKKSEPITISEKESLDILRQLIAKLAKKDIKLMVYDVYRKRGNARIAKLFRENNIPFFELNIRGRKEFTFGDLDEHTSQIGHHVIADAFYKTLSDSIIPVKYLNPDSGLAISEHK